MKVLITGGSGFIGSKVMQKLVDLGHEVYNYDLPMGNDLLNLIDLENYIINVDVVYHIAAQADLTQMTDINAARHGVITNVHGTHNVAFLCAKHRKWIIYASTVCVYGNTDTHPEKEDSTLPNPSELYACSKYAGEWLIKGYSLNFGNPYTILRFATIYGEGMREALGMHIFFKQALKGEDITVHGDGLQDRTLTYIHDLVDGIVAPLSHRKKAENQVINLSALEAVSAKKMAEDIKELTGTKSDIKFIEQRANQTFHEDFDVSKAEKILNWKAKTTWQEGLKNTLLWMKTEI